MALVELEIQKRGPFADGVAFGEHGSYERIDGVARFAVDPEHPANQAIVDLDKAERDTSGRVHFLADFCILQPADPARGRRALLFDILNRGLKGAVRRFNLAPQPAVHTEAIDPGDGFLMRHGWTVGWCGWQWDVFRSDALLGIDVPQALGPDGKPIVGTVAVEFQPNSVLADHLLADRIHKPYTAADLDQPDAVLTVREWQGGERTTIPRERWRFVREMDGTPIPDADYVWLEGGFQPGFFYEVIYQTRNCPVAGCGLLSMRDFASFLRFASEEDSNPCAGRLDRAYSYGISQSGRFLRLFLSLGLNLDEAGRQVFDGLIPQVAGGRRGQFNQRYAQPSDQSMPSFGHLMPFADDPQTDPLTGDSGGLLDRQRQLGGVPRVFTINTSAEYWRGDASLIHTDLADTRDVEPPAEVRCYLLSSTQHGRGAVPLVHESGNEGDRGANGLNAINHDPLIRAALMNLDAWVAEGVEPPASAFPRIADGTAITPEEALARFHAIPGAVGRRSRAEADGLAHGRGARGGQGHHAAAGPPGRAVPELRLGAGRGRQRGGWHPDAGHLGPRRHLHRLEPSSPRNGRRGPDQPDAGIDVPVRGDEGRARAAQRSPPLDRGAVPRPGGVPGAGSRRCRGAGGTTVPAGRRRGPGRPARG